jgi:hypothetical protein
MLTGPESLLPIRVYRPSAVKEVYDRRVHDGPMRRCGEPLTPPFVVRRTAAEPCQRVKKRRQDRQMFRRVGETDSES